MKTKKAPVKPAPVTEIWPMLSIGQNTKLDKKIAIFNLPSHSTCPWRTALCDKICYAQKAERMYKAAKAKRIRNLKFSGLHSFVPNMIKELKESGVTKCRIHESGDFYNPEYVDKWVDIATACPEIKFLAFTKSFLLDFSKMPSNVVIGWSVDDTTTLNVPKGRFQAYLCAKGNTPPKDYYKCSKVDSKNGHTHYCGSATGCNWCWEGKGNVVWPQH